MLILKDEHDLKISLYLKVTLIIVKINLFSDGQSCSVVMSYTHPCQLWSLTESDKLIHFKNSSTDLCSDYWFKIAAVCFRHTIIYRLFK